jgi:hypothetical protein
MATTDVNMNEVLISPLASMVREIGSAVSDAQRALDAAAIEQQAALAQQHPELQALGYQVTWYQIPEASVEMKMTLHFEKKQPGGPARMYLAPFNTKYRNVLSFAAEGSSTLKLRIVPVPPVSGA